MTVHYDLIPAPATECHIVCLARWGLSGFFLGADVNDRTYGSNYQRGSMRK